MELEEISIDFVSTLEITSDVILITDRQGEIIYVNHSFEKITGYKKDEAIGNNPRILKSGFQDDAYYKNLWDTILSGHPYRGIVLNKKKNGDFYHEEITICPSFNTSGDISHFISIGKDITERIEYEKKEERLLKNLEMANRDLENFNRTASHDLRNPLFAIRYTADKIYKKYGESFASEDVELCHGMIQSLDFMNNLINDLLDYSKTGNKTRKEKLDLNVLIKKIYKNYSSANIDLTICNRLPKLTINERAIRQVFENLISNSVKYMDKPSGVIEIGCEKDESFWKFFVRDNGAGIEERYLDTLFRPFQKAHNRKDIQSCGLGLSIVKKILENEGGQVWLETELGKGSVFYFTVPK